MRLLMSGCLIAIAAGCTETGDTPAPAPPVDEPAPVTVEHEVLARVARGGASVEWVRPKSAPAEVGAVVIRGRSGEAPIIDMDAAEKLRPVELYLALSTEVTIPKGLAAIATQKDHALVGDRVALAALRARVSAHGEQLAAQIAAATPAFEPYVGTCTAGEIATARAVFGQGYGSTTSCGDNPGWLDSGHSYFYCNGGGDCDYPLGELDSCDLSNPCDYAQGSVDAFGMRSVTNGNPHMLTNAHRIRGFAYNCDGNGALTMSLRYGAATWDTQVDVPVNTHTGVYVWGSGLLQERAIAISLIANGNIFDGIPASGATYDPVEYLISGNAGANDRGVFCTDTQQSLTITNVSNPASCGHGFVSWCTDYCGGCFD